MKSSIGPQLRGWLILSLWFGSLFTASAQVPTWQWAESSSFEKLASIYGPGEDQTGALYIAGSFKDSLTLGSQFLKSSGFNDGYVAKLRRGRGWQWAVRINGGRRSDDYVQAMDVDAAGNVYVGGAFPDTLYVGDTVLTNNRGTAFFLAKFDSTGQFRWAAKGQALSANMLSGSVIRALRVDNAGHVYVGGQYSWPLGVGSLQLPGGNSPRTFVARVTEAGSWEWATPTLGSGNCQISSVEVDAAGNVYANGFIQGAVLFGSTSLVVRPTSTELFAACLRPTGSWKWAVRGSTGSTGNGSGANSMAMSPTGQLYVAGYFNGTALSIANGAPASGGGNLDGFIARLDTSTGASQWIRAVASGGIDEIKAVLADSAGAVYVTGTFSRTVTLDTTHLTIPGTGSSRSDLFVGKLSGSGAWDWALRAGGGAYATPRHLIRNREGQLLIGMDAGSVVGLGPITISDPGGPGTGRSCVLIASLGVTMPTGLPDVGAPTFSITPNPAHAWVQVRQADGGEALLLDALGQRVRMAPLVNGEGEFKVSDLPKGLYLLRVGKRTRRLLVQ